MITLDVQLIELEQRWREADDVLRAARAEQAASNQLTVVQSNIISARIEQAERLKKSIIEKIEALEESSLVN
jgi:hypothetical protein